MLGTWKKINEQLMKDEDFGLQLRKRSFYSDPEPEGLHQCLAVRVVALTQNRETGVGGLPEPGGEGEGVEDLQEH